MSRSAVTTLAVAAVAAGGGLAGASRLQAAVADPRLTLESQAVAPGEALVLEGRGFPRNARIALLAGPPDGEAQRIGGAQTGRRGVFTATIRIREQADPGRFVALACHDACRVKASVRFRIVAP